MDEAKVHYAVLVPSHLLVHGVLAFPQHMFFCMRMVGRIALDVGGVRLSWCAICLVSLNSSSPQCDHSVYPIQKHKRRVSNPVYCCINCVFCELRHGSVMNIL